jgi:hypothetical protein
MKDSGDACAFPREEIAWFVSSICAHVFHRRACCVACCCMSCAGLSGWLVAFLRHYGLKAIIQASSLMDHWTKSTNFETSTHSECETESNNDTDEGTAQLRSLIRAIWRRAVDEGFAYVLHEVRALMHIHADVSACAHKREWRVEQCGAEENRRAELAWSGW